MEDWQQRIIEERDELDVKMFALREHLNTEHSQSVNRLLLQQQLEAMIGYYNILRIRIALFKDTS